MDNSRMLYNLFPRDEKYSKPVKMIKWVLIQQSIIQLVINFVTWIIFSFKAATTTALTKAVKRMATILNSKASQILNVSQSVIEEVLSNETGDVRNAQLNLIFASLKRESQLPISR